MPKNSYSHRALANKKALERQKKDATPSPYFDAIMLLDKMGELIFVNQSAERIFGYSSGSTLGKTLAEFVHPADVSRLSLVLASILSGSRGISTQLRLKKKNGSVVYVEMLFTSMIGINGDLVIAVHCFLIKQ